MASPFIERVIKSATHRAGRISARVNNAVNPGEARLREVTLDAFVAETDAIGGVGALDLTGEWAYVSYTPTFQVDQTLDPFSEAYVEQQLRLYREISGREVDQEQNELTPFEIERHVAQPNAFGASPEATTLHFLRLARLMRLVRPQVNAKLLDLGCGWGMTSEFFASMGLRVTAADINPQFVELVRRRSAARGLGIRTLQGSFEDLKLDEPYDNIMFYECMHHAIRPWVVISKYAKLLTPTGCIAFAGEPVQNLWWKDWGLRLDPVSVYCIRKYGWFESGWSMEFLVKVFAREGLALNYILDSDPEVGGLGFARRGVLLDIIDGARLIRAAANGSWLDEGRFQVASGDNTLEVDFGRKDGHVCFRMVNYRQADIALSLTDAQGITQEHLLRPGDNAIVAPYAGPGTYRFVSERWYPSVELGSADTRGLSFHLRAIDFLQTVSA